MKKKRPQLLTKFQRLRSFFACKAIKRAKRCKKNHLTKKLDGAMVNYTSNELWNIKEIFGKIVKFQTGIIFIFEFCNYRNHK